MLTQTNNKNNIIVMEKNYKISYQKHWDKEGTTYNQRVKISKELYSKFCNDMTLEIFHGFPLKDKYCHTSGDTIFMYHHYLDAKIVYLHSTERRFFSLMTGIKLKDRNTYLVIE